MTGNVALSFDFEECDLPRERGVDFPIEEGMKVSVEGANAVLDVLNKHGIKATFFCTLNFAERAPEVMHRIIAGGHEVAAHGVDHFHQEASDPFRCMEGLRSAYGVSVVGYRQPRMFPVDDAALAKAGYRYNSSLNPAFVPGRYMHLRTPRRMFFKNGLVQVPASVVPGCRFPLFWLALHLLPEWLYFLLVKITLAFDGYFVTYFHPWEFSSISKRAAELRIPRLIRVNLGASMIGRLDRLIAGLKRRGVSFVTIQKLVEERKVGDANLRL